MVYSNQGFAIAGAMLETITDTPYEKLMTEKLFAPLKMTTAGFGVPARSVATPGELEPALRWALDAEGPALVHVRTDPLDLGPGHPGRPNWK